MKRGVCILMAGVLLCSGCSSKQQSASSSAPKEVRTERKSEAWLVNPKLDYDEVYEITPKGLAFMSLDTKQFGTLNVSYEMEMSEYPSTMAGYSEDGVIVEKNSRQGIFSANGKQLYPIELDMMNSYQMAGVEQGWKKENGKYSPAYGITSETTGKAQVFSDDFRKLEEVSMDDYLSTPPAEEDANPYFALKNDKFGVVAMTRGDAGNSTGWAFEELDPSILKTRVIIDTVDEYCNSLSKVIYDPSSNSSIPLSTDGSYVQGSFVDGFYRISNEGTVSVISVASSTVIASQYQDAGLPQEGYIPTKKYGKWGYMTTDGTEVTDYIFDDAKAVLHGYAYVKYEGKWGILKLSSTLEKNAQINISTVSSSSDKELGKVEVMADNLTIRDDAGSSSSFLGNACTGSIYPYYETKQDGDYTWYRIADHAWIADSNGEWLKTNG